MEENNTGYLNNDGKYVIGRKSWVSYISIFFALGCYCLILYSLIYFDLFNSIDSYFILNTGVNISIVSTVFILICIYYLYSIIVLRSFKLFMTDSGVFYEFGIFPWSKRGDGIHWKDIDHNPDKGPFLEFLSKSEEGLQYMTWDEFHNYLQELGSQIWEKPIPEVWHIISRHKSVTWEIINEFPYDFPLPKSSHKEFH